MNNLDVLKQAREFIFDIEWSLERDRIDRLLTEAIAEAEKQEPFGHVTVRRLSQRYENHADLYAFYPSGQSPYLDNVDECHSVYTSPPQRQPLTDEKMFEFAEIAWRHGWASCRDAEYVGEEAEDERWGMVGAEVVQDIAAHGIKGEA